jgi:hypothetical protein
MARTVVGDPGTWEAARELGKQLTIPVGPYEPRIPTADEMNAVFLYLLDRATRHYEKQYYCDNAEVAFAHLFGMNVPRQGFPRSDGFSRHGFDWNGYNVAGFDANGYNREGFNKYGLDKEGYNKDGYNDYGYDREGFNIRGTDQNGRTREEYITDLVTGWSDDFAAAIAAHVAQLKANEPVVKPTVAKKATKRAPIKIESKAKVKAKLAAA